MKPYRVECVQLAGWEASETGLWLAESDEWLLLRHIPVDYVVDGYVLLAKAHIATRKPGRSRKQVEKILKLKGVKAEAPASFHFQNTLGLLRWAEQHYGVVEFTDEEESLFLGWITQADAAHFWVDFLTPKGEEDRRGSEGKPFCLAEIQRIRFDTDYTNSLKLLWQYKQQLKRQRPSVN